MPDPAQSLAALGFTRLEAEAYVHLLRNPSTTGYQVARAIGKPTANTYKAIEALAARGAVMIDHGARRLCRAVPVEEILRRHDRESSVSRERVRRALAGIIPDTTDELIYRLRSREQVIERACTMLARCRHVALVDAFPATLEAIHDDLGRAIQRGATIGIKVYAPTRLPGAHLVLGPDAAAVVEAWPGQLNVVVDAEEVLLAAIAPDRQVLHALWSRSSFLASLLHSALSCELAITDIGARIAAGGDLRAVREALRLQNRLLSPAVPGRRQGQES